MFFGLTKANGLMNLPDENSCIHEFTQIGQQFNISCGWKYEGAQG
jgi:hypothetical protein